MRHGRSLVRLFLHFAWVLALASPAMADIDLTGRWQTSPGNYAQIAQSGGQVVVSFTRTISGIGTIDFAMAGTFNQTSLTATDGSGFRLAMTQYGQGRYLEGVLAVIGSFNSGGEIWTRCQCYDGNNDDGDGCSSGCQIEPCFTCSPEPSDCVPSADSDPCDDGRDCTTGETCTAGICGNGTTEPSCIDMTGEWRVSTDSYTWVLNERNFSAGQLTLTQRHGVLFGPSLFGSLDPLTGQFRLFTRGGAGPLCGFSYSFDGVASPDGQTYTGNGATYFSHIRGCWTGSTIEQDGYRCGEVTGCDLTGCSGVPDGTACRSDTPCSDDAACTAGACIGHPTCPACTTCDGAGACIAAPRNDCTTSIDPGKGQMQIKLSEDGAGNQLRWRWKAGPQLALEDFGNPQGSDDVSLCLFAVPPGAEWLLASTTMTAGSCSEPPCWSDRNGKRVYKANGGATSPITGMTLASGNDGKTSVDVRAAGSGLFDGMGTPPYPMPIRSQLQIGNGACFELDFATETVKSNDYLRFKASGTSLP